MEIEIEYIEKKIKKELIDNDFNNWNKESILFLSSIFEFKKYNKLYDLNLILLNDYIKWYEKNTEQKIESMYNIELLKKLYILIKEDILYNEHYNYENFLNENKIENISNNKNYYTIFDYFYSNNYCGLSMGLMMTIIYIILKYIIALFYNKKKEEKRHIFELKIPIPDNLINNSLIKLFLDKF